MGRHKKQKEHLIPKPSLNLSSETKKGIAVILFVILFLISLLSLFGKAGIVGQYIDDVAALARGSLRHDRAGGGPTTRLVQGSAESTS